jgi:hypothetical protein
VLCTGYSPFRSALIRSRAWVHSVKIHCFNRVLLYSLALLRLPKCYYSVTMHLRSLSNYFFLYVDILLRLGTNERNRRKRHFVPETAQFRDAVQQNSILSDAACRAVFQFKHRTMSGAGGGGASPVRRLRAARGRHCLSRSLRAAALRHATCHQIQVPRGTVRRSSGLMESEGGDPAATWRRGARW